MEPAALVALAGRTLPGGRYTIDEKDNRDFCKAVGATPDPEGLAHPLFYYIATQSAMGLSVAELLALCEFDINDGPMMVGSNASFAQDLRVGIDYDVSGSIVSIVRKPSRAFGVADTLTFQLALSDPEGRESAIATSSWILPRRTLA